ncbi:MAG: helix-turn-helix domain-containing protein [Bacteroidota bacterium]
MGTEHFAADQPADRPEISISPYLIPGTLVRKREISEVLEILLEELNITREEITIKTRKREILSKVQVMTYLMIWYGFTQAATGAVFNRDHATALHSYRTVKNELLTNKELKDFVIRMQYTRLRKDFSLITVVHVDYYDKYKKEKLGGSSMFQQFKTREELNDWALELKEKKEGHYGREIDSHLTYTELSNCMI